ncbi:MAG TPA: YtxH domain-containing protein [Chitinophagaceae bacterium]|nr:YtxH domain-containing protein [Chitinophagaceae bacterium]
MSAKFISGIILGAAAGAALALFLTSDKGREILEDISDAAGNAADKAKDQLENLNDELASLLKRGKAFVEDLEQKTKEATS